jgi:hypothetical protein
MCHWHDAWASHSDPQAGSQHLAQEPCWPGSQPPAGPSLALRPRRGPGPQAGLRRCAAAAASESKSVMVTVTVPVPGPGPAAYPGRPLEP